MHSGSAIRQQLDDVHMPADDAPADEDVRQTYNFAPGNIGLVYRADVPDYGAGPSRAEQDGEEHDDEPKSPTTPRKTKKDEITDVHYKLQAMKWGLIPSWTKRSPDYGTIMRTINCRDDSLSQTGGMWANMKKRKRCIVICQGFYEWLKKNDGKEKIPHYIKRKDGGLMLLAGLWDCVKYDDAEEKTYTYTIITTDNNKQMSFLHNRMPVLFEPASEELRAWLDPNRYTWSSELQQLLKPFQGELEIYPVNKEVGKVGNNSPSFIIPIDSKENKRNIANFFGNQAKLAKSQKEQKHSTIKDEDLASEIELEQNEKGEVENSETNAPLASSATGSLKREHDEAFEADDQDSQAHKRGKLSPIKSPERQPSSPVKTRKMHSATSNGIAAKGSPVKAAAAGSQKITSFFGKKRG